MMVMLGFSNAVNLTDGLDGLAIVPTIIAAGVFALIAYLVGNRIFADYLQLNFVPGVGELAVFCSALIGAGTRASCGSTRRRRRCSWAIPGRWRSAARWARWRWRPSTRSCWASSAGCSWSRRSASSCRCSGSSAPDGACS